MTDSWAFITSHAAVLIEVNRNPKATIRTIAGATGLTERQVHRVIADLCESGYVTRNRHGRRNEYEINPERRMRHRTVAHLRIEELLNALSPGT